MRVPLEKGGDGLACRVDRFAETMGWGGWHRRPENPSDRPGSVNPPLKSRSALSAEGFYCPARARAQSGHGPGLLFDVGQAHGAGAGVGAHNAADVLNVDFPLL